MGISNFITFDAHDPRVQNHGRWLYLPRFQSGVSQSQPDSCPRCSRERQGLFLPCHCVCFCGIQPEPNLHELENAMPIAPLKIVALRSASKMGRQINDYLVEFRRSIHNDKVKIEERHDHIDPVGLAVAGCNDTL